MRRRLALLLLSVNGAGLSAQAPPSTPPDELWSGRLAVGWMSQDAYAYAGHGLVLGGTVARAVGESWLARLDFAHATYTGRVDLSGCSGMPFGGFCYGMVRASDKQQDWLLSLTAERRLQERGFYVIAGLVAAYSSGRELDQAGFAPGATLGVGLRFGNVLAVEARLVELLGPSRREAWRVPIVMSFGP